MSPDTTLSKAWSSGGAAPSQPAGAPPLDGIDHVRLYVGNAKQTAYFLSTSFGMTVCGYRGPEGGYREHCDYWLESGRVRFLVTGGAAPGATATTWAAAHGDGVCDIAFTTRHVDELYEHATGLGACGYEPPHDETDEHGTIRVASIGTYGHLRHTLVDRSKYRAKFLPGFDVVGPLPNQAPQLFHDIDHTVGCVELGELERWVRFYQSAFGFGRFAEFTGDDIATEYSALMSTVVADGSGRIKLPLNEPAPGRRRSQIDEYLQYHDGPGVQHIALITSDIVAAVDVLRERGVTFLRTPLTYYDDPVLAARIGEIRLPVAELRSRGILVDRDEDGYLLQIFTNPIVDRPTMFIELIERNGATGFGKGNFKALFEAVEREQARRGNL
ncbi:4-hydroxyphenylpyruvate dioxygenase [Amycolatopsis japonica]